MRKHCLNQSTFGSQPASSSKFETIPEEEDDEDEFLLVLYSEKELQKLRNDDLEELEQLFRVESASASSEVSTKSSWDFPRKYSPMRLISKKCKKHWIVAKCRDLLESNKLSKSLSFFKDVTNATFHRSTATVTRAISYAFRRYK